MSESFNLSATRMTPLEFRRSELEGPSALPSTREMIRDAHMRQIEGIESALLCIMAAGVSASEIKFSEPELKVDGFNARITCQLSFK